MCKTARGLIFADCAGYEKAVCENLCARHDRPQPPSFTPPASEVEAAALTGLRNIQRLLMGLMAKEDVQKSLKTGIPEWNGKTVEQLIQCIPETLYACDRPQALFYGESASIFRAPFKNACKDACLCTLKQTEAVEEFLKGQSLKASFSTFEDLEVEQECF
ncbi:unnamed protein product [Enterobius vermicularis]|uniref:DUF3109 family protein n=1 Tax=Enterobius vermicularis TaxID=51028 RepID=A0A0N4V238_ENTVE|nr:unnamed protein product [Enterobius vermicularis]